MSYIPIRDAKDLKAISCRRFLGLNRKEYASYGEFSDMKNLSAELYPYLSPSKPRGDPEKYSKINIDGTETEAENIRAAIAPLEESGVTGFCGVIGTKFYYDGEEKPLYQPAVYDESNNYLYGMRIPSDGKIQLLWVNKVLLIHGYDSSEAAPFIYYYNTAPEDETDEDCIYSYEYDHKGDYGETVKVSSNGNAEISFTITKPTSFEGGFYKLKAGDSVFVDGLMTYSDSRWGVKSTQEIISAVVSSYSETVTSISSGNKTWSVSLTLTVKNHLGEAPNVDIYSRRIYHIYKKIPYMTHIALHKGRLWGASPNGELVYASALNDVFNFNQFDGISDDSVYIESSSQGGYLGVISCGNAVAALKKNSFEAIYGELPNEFAVGKSYDGIGCIDINSCAVANNILYFLGSRGFYMWNGSRPVLISEPLDRQYTSACGFSDGLSYRVCAYDTKTYENLVYDLKRMLWHKEDNEKITCCFTADRKNYAAVNGKLAVLDGGTGKIEWSAESTKLLCEDYDMDRINEMWIYMKSEEDGELEVFSSADGGSFKSEGRFTVQMSDGKIYRVPIRLREGIFWQYKLKGKGRAVIYGIKILYDKGGRCYSNDRF